MRIIGGKAKGRKIVIPRGIRPTQDKIRATIFDVLGEEVKGTEFLDLFAGSGAVGIEALSRGAKETIFVEHSKKVRELLKENIISLGYMDRAKIIPKDALKFLETIRPNHQRIIFADPPYNKGWVEKLLHLRTIGQASLFIIEHSKHEPVNIGKHYKSGDTFITFI